MLQLKTSIWDRYPGLIEALRDLSSMKSYSAAQIAIKLSDRFGIEVSRNAVIGKATRLGLMGDGYVVPKVRQPPKLHIVAKPVPKDGREPLPKGDVDRGCRYLHGDAYDRNFCGAETTRPSTSWCAYHSEKVWSKGVMK